MKIRDCSRGQALVESLFITVIITAVFFAAVQLCIMAVDDMLCNEAAFSAIRAGVVTPARDMRDVVKKVSDTILLPHSYTRLSIILDDNTLWHDTIAGQDIRDHGGAAVQKYDVGIKYTVRIMFASLMQPFTQSVFFSGGKRTLSRVASARMVKSPDEEYYYKAYPKAPVFTKESRAQ
ncbi:MAG: hypothetical protein NTU66_07065 [Elusimicrobia bacterium]|nr:hypothetical protein [Elusimicrobiota bacterium]